MKKQLLIIDGSSYIFRAFYGVRAGLKNSDGFPTNAVFGFKNMLLQLLKNEDPSHCVMVFDKAGPTFRNEIYAEYKSNRDAAPEDLVVQFEPIFRFSRLLNLPVIEAEGVEADDVIGSLVRKFSKEIKVTIISGDKDLTQLVNDEVCMYDTMNDKLYDPENVRKKFGVAPEQIPQYLALIGDSSDNIPGASGIGPKTAVKLFDQYGSIDGIFENIERIKGRQKENLLNSKENIELSLKLATIDCDVEVTSELNDFERGESDFSGLKDFYQEMDFRPDDLLTLHPDAGEESFENPDRSKLDYGSYEAVTDRNRLKEIIKAIEASGVMVLDLETTSLHPIEAEIVGFALAWEGESPVYVPVGHNTFDQQLDVAEVLEILKPIFGNSEISFIGQNIKYEIMVLANYNITVRCAIRDTMLESYLLDASLHRHNLDELAERHLGHKMIKYEDVVGRGKKQISFADVPLETALTYAAEDADATLKIHKKLYPKVKEEGLLELYEDVELPLSRILAMMERYGVKLDRDYLAHLNTRLNEELGTIRQKIYEAAGREFNINSTQQLGKILFDDLGITIAKKKTKTGYSTDASVLEKIALFEPIGKDLLDYRTKTKLINTYLEVLPLLINKKTGRVHTSYSQAVTATGRLSSSNPNLQNIPIKGEDGGKIRRAFIPEEGFLMLSADYSQIELRFLAHLSEDEKLISVFNKGGDIHSETAAAIYEIDPEEVTREQRQAAKAINFGIIYGMGAYRLSQEIAVSQKQATEFIEAYFRKYPGIKRYMDETVAFCRKHSYVQTMFKRKRLIPDIESRNRIARTAAERVAINSRIQGSAADLIKIAMIRMQEKIDRGFQDAKMIMQVHDELIFEVPEKDANAFKEVVKTTMESATTLKVPLVADAEVGRNWQEAH